MLVWCFIPFRVEGGSLSSDTYDTAATKADLARAFHALGRPWIWQPITLCNLRDIVQQVRGTQPALVLNLCDGVEAAGHPGISVVRALEEAGVPFTGADSCFYDTSTSKLAMKRLFDAASVLTPGHAEVPDGGAEGLCARLGVPLMVKPDVSAASRGISLRSKVYTDAAITARRAELRADEWAGYFGSGTVFVERFIDGPEFTVFVVGHWGSRERIHCLPVTERAFDDSIPEPERFLSFDRYWGYFREEAAPANGREFYFYRPVAEPLASRVAASAIDAFCAVRGTGYARVDLRMDRLNRELYVLEVNANPGISPDDESSAGSVLQAAGIPFANLLRIILDEALTRSSK